MRADVTSAGASVDYDVIVLGGPASMQRQREWLPGRVKEPNR